MKSTEKQGPKCIQKGQMLYPKHLEFDIIMQSHSKYKQNSQGLVHEGIGGTVKTTKM